MPWLQALSLAQLPLRKIKRERPSALLLSEPFILIEYHALLCKVEIDFPSNQKGRTNMKKYLSLLLALCLTLSPPAAQGPTPVPTPPTVPRRRTTPPEAPRR